MINRLARYCINSSDVSTLIRRLCIWHVLFTCYVMMRCWSAMWFWLRETRWTFCLPRPCRSAAYINISLLVRMLAHVAWTRCSAWCRPLCIIYVWQWRSFMVQSLYFQGSMRLLAPICQPVCRSFDFYYISFQSIASVLALMCSMCLLQQYTLYTNGIFPAVCVGWAQFSFGVMPWLKFCINVRYFVNSNIMLISPT